MNKSSILERLILALPSLKDQHAPSSLVYALLSQVARQEAEGNFQDVEPNPREFEPFGDVVIPYQSMGNRDSLNLFDLDELIIFSFYWINRKRYQRVLDLGANIGFHSILLSKCGFTVRAYEPDPAHFALLERNLDLNRSANVTVNNYAISTESGHREFVRVLENTYGNHLAGSKANPYGDLERFPVRVEPFQPLMGWADLIKMDVEGEEKEILRTTGHEDWLHTDAMVEVGSPENAEALFQHFNSIGVTQFSQKTGWSRVSKLEDMPINHFEGSLFVSCKDEMPWHSST